MEIYRFVVDDTLEEKIYHRQIFKKFIADKVLQDPTKQKLFEHSSMHELFEFPRKSHSEKQETELLLKRFRSAQSYNGSESKLKEMPSGAVDEEQEVEEVPEDKMEVKMYKINKRNIKKDEKAREFFKKAEKEMANDNAGGASAAVAKQDNNKDNLVVQIFQNKEEEEKFDPTKHSLSMTHINVKCKAREATFQLMQKMNKGQAKTATESKAQGASSASLLQNLMKARQEEADNDEEREI